MTADQLNSAAIEAIRRRELKHAEALLREAVNLSPEHSAAWNNLAAVLAERGANDEAADALRAAIRHDPTNCDSLANLAAMLHRLVRDDEATDAARRALCFRPDDLRTHMILAEALLRRGELVEGFAEYEHRARLPGFERFGRSHLPRPRWDGREALAGRTILLHAEQGFGDTIQMARYAPLVARRGGRVVLECDPSLVALLSTVKAVARVIGRSTVLPPFDLHCPLMSLPHAFGTTLETIPSEVPYLSADARHVEAWRAKLGLENERRRIGLAWSGRPTHLADARRSIAPGLLAPLTEVPGVDFISLQKDSDVLPPNVRATNLGDFADTAALVACLDLVITVDTAVAHLAGAMGKPVWTLLADSYDWRWLTERADTPWYPTMRLIRQSNKGDWAGVIRQVAGELSS